MRNLYHGVCSRHGDKMVHCYNGTMTHGGVFLIGIPNGHMRKRFKTSCDPQALRGDIVGALRTG